MQCGQFLRGWRQALPALGHLIVVGNVLKSWQRLRPLLSYLPVRFHPKLLERP